MAIDITLSTKTDNNVSIPVTVPGGATTNVYFRNSVAPTYTFTGGVLNVLIPAADALKFHGIDFFVVATISGIERRLLHGQFTVPQDVFQRKANITDVNAVSARVDANTAAIAAGGTPTLVPTQNITYDANGNVTSITENGVVTTFTYNANGTVNTESSRGKTRTWTYDANGNPISSVVS